VLAIPRTIGKISSSTTLAPDRLGVVAVVLFVISTAAPLTAVARVVPSRLALSGLSGVSHAYLGVAVVVALVSVDHVAMAPHATISAALCAYIASGLRRPAGDCASGVALSACIRFEWASHRGFGAIARLPSASFCRISEFAAPVR